MGKVDWYLRVFLTHFPIDTSVTILHFRPLAEDLLSTECAYSIYGTFDSLARNVRHGFYFFFLIFFQVLLKPATSSPKLFSYDMGWSMETTWFKRRKLEDIVATQKNVENSSVLAHRAIQRHVSHQFMNMGYMRRDWTIRRCTRMCRSLSKWRRFGHAETILIFSWLWRRCNDHTTSSMNRYGCKQYKESRKKI